MKKHILIFAVLSMLFISGCVTNTIPQLTDFSTFTSDVFAFNYPKTWQVENDNAMGIRNSDFSLDNKTVAKFECPIPEQNPTNSMSLKNQKTISEGSVDYSIKLFETNDKSASSITMEKQPLSRDETVGRYGSKCILSSKTTRLDVTFSQIYDSVKVVDKSANTMIKVLNPKPNQIISSPLGINGEARGTWYFEASFPVRLLDANGKVIATGIAEAQSDWMTENFVPFKLNLPFETPGTSSGTLVFQKDNPSGLPQYDAKFEVPVLFNSEKTKVQVYFSNAQKNPNIMDCSLSFPVEREIQKTPTIATAAINELLKGPTEAEKAAGFATTLNNGVKLNSLKIINGTAYADFDKKLDEQVGGSCRVTMIRSQITHTLLQFPSIKKVVISIFGETELILQP